MSYSTYPPPPRHSGSRSPSRAAYPPRPPFSEAGYPSDNYRQDRPDWEHYDRERAYYDRFDYGRRGRSRSPPLDEASRKRRRSMSPYDRERYDPRPRYDDYDVHGRYGYSPPGGRGRGGAYAGRRPPLDPHTFDYPASLKAFAEWFRYYYPQQAIDEDNADKAAEAEAADGTKPRNGIRARWEKYKKDFAAAQLQTMFDHHRKSPWFAEKYDPAPEFEKLRMRVRKVGWRDRTQAFLNDLELGKFDPEQNENSSEEPVSLVKEEANGDDVKVEDDMQFNVDADEDDTRGSGDANGKGPTGDKRANRGEEVSVQPEGNQVMIRTIPPDIGRIKLEDACSKIQGYMYLALGDPLQKRSYYRAGWLKFKEDADMAAVMAELTDKKIEGFKLHVSHNTRPFINRIRYAPEVASKPDRLEKDLANVKILAGILETQAATLRKFKPDIKKDEMKPEGDADADVAMEEALNGEEEEDAEPSEKGSEAVERRVEKILADMREQGLVDVNDEKSYGLKKTTVALDLYIAYLRAAYHTCYYCCVVTDHVEELHRKCVKHVRKPLSKALIQELKAAEAEAERKREEQQQQQQDNDQLIGENGKDKDKETKKEGPRDWKRNDERWVEWLDSKVALLINRDGVDPRDYGGKSYDEELSKAVDPFVKQEDEGKFRCKACLKLFKATSFVEKHIANKHPEHVKGLEEIPYFNNFALDPHRIQPFTHPPPAIGNNNNQAPPQAYGVQGPAHRDGYHDRFDSRNGGGGGGGGYGYYAPPPLYRDEYHHPGGYHPPPRRDETTTARRLSDRITGFADLPANAGLPPKPPASLLDAPLSSGNPRSKPAGRSGQSISGPPPPPPPDAKEDPRAAAGKRVSYHDMDLVAEGDVELSY